MKKINKGRVATVIAGAAVLAVFGGGTAVAGSLITSAQIKDSTIVSADVKDGGLKGADIMNSSLKGEDIVDGSIKSADVKNGSLSNDDISVFYASVNADGTLVESSSAVIVSKPATGRYGVRFAGKDIRTCAFTATPAAPTGIVAPLGVISAIDELNHPEGAYLFTRNLDGNDQDMGFHLTVVC
jgi:hypothetical protein